MSKWKLWMLVPAAIFAVLALVVGGNIGVATVARGPEAVGSGWISTLWTLLGGTGAFSLPALLTLLIGWFQKWKGVSGTSISVAGTTVPEIVELVQSFGVLVANLDSKPAQRRFVFALVDACDFVPGLQTSHENGVIVLRYSGFADPPAHNTPVTPPAPVSGFVQSR